RRWHISLSSWFRDYVYIPLGGSFSSTRRRIINILLTFSISGLWHGANWTFIAWGALNGLYYIPLLLAKNQKRFTNIAAEGRLFPGSEEFARIFNTMLLTMLAWVFFRSPTLTDALLYILRIFTHPYLSVNHAAFFMPVMMALGLLAIEWIQRSKQHALQFESMGVLPRWVIYQSLGVLILLFASFGNKEFIYFQF
ncbi:MBOAT family O-acyltransferase, partial [Calditrichota bacterium]